MATPIFDRLAQKLVKLIPTTFKTEFTIGAAMPDAEILTADMITGFLNDAMMNIFNRNWISSYEFAKGDPKKTMDNFMAFHPELARWSEDITIEDSYTIATPYLNLFKTYSAIGAESIFIAGMEPGEIPIAVSSEYEEFQPSSTDPIIIQIGRSLKVYPVGSGITEINVLYIALPTDPTTGLGLVQNGNYDVSFSPHWYDMIVKEAYKLFLEEAQETI